MLNNCFYRQTFSKLAMNRVSVQLHDLAETHERKDPLVMSEHPNVYTAICPLVLTLYSLNYMGFARKPAS
jgi:hypothetical protein